MRKIHLELLSMRMPIILDILSRQTLNQMYKKHPKSQVRKRAQALLLKDKGFHVDTISEVLFQGSSTIYRWFKHWNKEGLAGLYDLPGRGRPRILAIEDRQKLEELIQQEPRKLDAHQCSFKKNQGKSVIKRTLKRALRSLGYTWKRMRKWLGNKRDEDDFRAAHQELASLKVLEDKGVIDLYYCDESGFNLVPNVPYGWQKVGETICLSSARSPAYNVLGFMKRDSTVDAFGFQGSINTEIVISCMNTFCQQREEAYEKKGLTAPVAYVIIDNAPIHNSKGFRAHEPKWEAMGVRIKRIPAYSPELNLIEIMWRKIKYEWLPLKEYKTIHELEKTVNEVISNIGSKFLIYFG